MNEENPKGSLGKVVVLYTDLFMIYLVGFHPQAGPKKGKFKFPVIHLVNTECEFPLNSTEVPNSLHSLYISRV